MKHAAVFWGRRAAVCGVLLLLGAAGHWLLALAGGFVLGGLYWYSVRQFSDVPCWLCGGSGTRSHRGLLAFLFGRALGRCLRCRGNKVNTRWGARVLGR